MLPFIYVDSDSCPNRFCASFMVQDQELVISMAGIQRDSDLGLQGERKVKGGREMNGYITEIIYSNGNNSCLIGLCGVVG